MNLLTVGPQNVFPPVDGGKEGIFGALVALARQCNVTYAFFAAGETPDLSGYARAGIHAVPVDWVPAETAGSILSATSRLRPYKFDKYSNAQAVQAFAAALPLQRPDAILCFHAHTARLGEGLRDALGLSVPVIVREHNIEYELVESYRESLPPLKRGLAWPIAALTRREEERIWADADMVAFLSDRDLATAQASGVPGRFILAREGIPLPPRRAAAHPGADAPLLILLNAKAAQSVSNLSDFLQRHWRAVASDPRLLQTELHITGIKAEALAPVVGMDIAELDALRVRALGFLPSLVTALSSSLALLSPTFVGGGIRKKVLEAMAHQLPVIATRLDIETCAYFDPGINILELSDRPENLCAQVAALRDDADLWQRLSDAGRRTVEVNADWDGFASAVIAGIRGHSRTLSLRTA